jgi:hypothetical protein
VRAILGAIAEQLGVRASQLFAANSLESSLTVCLRHPCRAQAREGLAAEGAKEAVRLFEHPDFEQAVIQAAEHFRLRGLRESIMT